MSGETLQYRCGPLHGTIPIRQIREIKQNQYLWAGLRPALGLHGLVINYNRWDTIYLSPAQKEAFLQALQEVNPQIVVE
ncbi:PH domain-containing protein [Rufibacter roseolus]|uniref:PH domain-containing protein n=1 Tax=Rufibacter roseolus TaxID=2817375 RepID=UPI001B314BE5